MKQFILIFVVLFAALPLMAQSSNVYMTQDKNKTPLVLKSMQDFTKMITLQGKDKTFSLNMQPVGSDSYVFWFTPKNWTQEKDGSSVEYNTREDRFNFSILLSETESDKTQTINDIGEDLLLQAQTPLNIDDKQLILQQYTDSEDKTLSIDIYSLSYGGISLIFNADYPVNQISKVTKTIQDIIRSVGTLTISSKTTPFKDAVSKYALGDVKISPPDVKNMVTIEFPVGKRIFSTQIDAATDIEAEKNRIYFDCGDEAACRLFLQKMPEVADEIFLTKQNKFYKGKVKKLADSSSTYGRTKVRAVKNTVGTQTVYNYFFTNGEKFVLTLKTTKPFERPALKKAHTILENVRIKDNPQTQK